MIIVKQVPFLKPNNLTSSLTKIKSNKNEEEQPLTLSSTSKNENTKNNNNSISLLEITDKSVFFL